MTHDLMTFESFFEEDAFENMKPAYRALKMISSYLDEELIDDCLVSIRSGEEDLAMIRLCSVISLGEIPINRQLFAEICDFGNIIMTLKKSHPSMSWAFPEIKPGTWLSLEQYIVD
jgi:hypothetical protein